MKAAVAGDVVSAFLIAIGVIGPTRFALRRATWFRDRGLPLPLYFAGFGEDQLAVPTIDNVDEVRNRRVDYVVGVEEPAFGHGRFVQLR